MSGSKSTLLVRPSQLFGESWGGYLLRLASANHLSGLNQLARSIKLNRSNLLCAQPTRVLEAFGIKSKFESGLQEDRINHGHVKHMHKAGRIFANRYCPSCIATDEVPYMRVEWERPTLLHCQQHLCMLESICSNCKQPLTYKRKNLLKCDCGFALAKKNSVPLPGWLANYYKSLEIEIDYQPVTFSPIREEDSRSYASVTRLINLVRKVETVCDPKLMSKGSLTEMQRKTDLQCLERVFINWPTGFKEMAASYLENRKISYMMLGANLFGSKGFDAFRAPLEDMKKTKQEAFKIHRSVEVQWLTEKKNEYVSKNQFKKRTGLSESEVMKLIKLGKLDGVIKNEATYECLRYAIPKRHISTYAKYKSQMSSPKDASLEIGLSEVVVQHLARRNVFARLSLENNGTNFRLDPVELSGFASKITGGKVKHFKEGKELINASVALVLLIRRGGKDVIPFLRDVLSEKIKKFAHEKAPIYVHDIYFELRTIEAYGLRARGRPRKKITPEYLHQLESL